MEGRGGVPHMCMHIEWGVGPHLAGVANIGDEGRPVVRPFLLQDRH